VQENLKISRAGLILHRFQLLVEELVGQCLAVQGQCFVDWGRWTLEPDVYRETGLKLDIGLG